MKTMEIPGGFPTVLVAELDEDVSAALSRSLRNEGYNVLEAHDWSGTVQFIRTHSRPIHILLAKVNRASPGLAETLKPYRPEMHVLFISEHPTDSLPNVLRPEAVLAGVHELLEPPRSHSRVMSAPSGDS